MLYTIYCIQAVVLVRHHMRRWYHVPHKPQNSPHQRADTGSILLCRTRGRKLLHGGYGRFSLVCDNHSWGSIRSRRRQQSKSCSFEKRDWQHLGQWWEEKEARPWQWRRLGATTITMIMEARERKRIKTVVTGYSKTRFTSQSLLSKKWVTAAYQSAWSGRKPERLVKESSRTIIVQCTSHDRPVESINTCEEQSLGEQDRTRSFHSTCSRRSTKRGTSPNVQTNI